MAAHKPRPLQLTERDNEAELVKPPTFPAPWLPSVCKGVNHAPQFNRPAATATQLIHDCRGKWVRDATQRRGTPRADDLAGGMD